MDIQCELKAFSRKHLEMFREILNNEIIQRAGLLPHARPFRIGDTVRFMDKKGLPHVMIVQRINHQSISGIEHAPTGRIKWRVGPTLLTLVEE